LTLKFAKNVSPPGPCWGTYNAPPDPLVGPTPVVFGKKVVLIGHDFHLFSHGVFF